MVHLGKQSSTGRAPVFVYGFAVVLTLLTLLARLSFSPWIGDGRPLLIIFFIPIIFSAYVGGLGPGLVATIVAGLGAEYYLLPPTHSFLFAKPVDVVQWLFFVGGGVLASVLTEALHRARNRAITSQRMYAVTLASIGDAVITTDARGWVTFLNPEAERLTGWKNMEAAGQPLLAVFRIINEETRAPVEDPVEKVFRTGSVVGLANHTVLIARNGAECVIDDSAAPIRQPDGTIMGVVLVFRDNTEKKKAEDMIRISEERLRFALETIHTDAWSLNLADHTAFRSLEHDRIFGYAELLPEWTYEKFLGHVLPDDRAMVDAKFQQAVKSQGDWSFECRIRRTDGEVRWIWAAGRHHQYTAEAPVQMAGIVKDITERKTSEERQRQEQTLLRTLIDLAPDFIFIKDQAGRYLVVNQSLAKCYCRQPAEMLGRTDADFLSPELAARFRAGELKTLAADSFCTIEDSVTFPDGQPCTVVTNMMAFRDAQGKVAGLVGIGRDITRQKTAEQSLRESETRLSTIFNSSPIGTVITRFADGQIWDANEVFAQSLGYRMDEILDGNFSTMRLWADPQQRAQMIELLNKQGRCKDLEVKLRKKNGTEVDRLVAVEIIHLAGEKCLLSLVQDHTERKQAEAQLLRLAAIVKFSDDAIISTTLDGIIISWNRGAEQIFGHTAAEAIGQAIQMLLPAGRHHEETEILTQIGRGENVVRFETVRIRKDGKPIDVSVTVSPLKDSSGKIIGASKIARDITEAKQAEEKIALERARFKLIFDTMPIGIAFHTIRPDGTFTGSINDAHLRICGITHDQHKPETYAKISHPDDWVVQQQFKEQVKAGLIKQFSMEKRYLHADGKVVWVNFSYQRDIYPDGTIEELTTVADITEHKRLGEQLRQSQKMEAIGQLAGGVAHDFNNILAIIQIQIDLLASEGHLLASQQDYAREIGKATQRAANLTRQLLLFSRKQQPQPRDLDLNDIVTNITKMLQRTLGEEVQLHFQLAPESLFIHADLGMMDQILVNLAVNARDAMPQGGRLVIETDAVEFDAETAARVPQARPGSYACLTVSDTGRGIPAHILPRIFEPFFTTKDVGKGTGLGLATVFGIVQQHQGWVSVYSEAGLGATFRIYLPRLATTSSLLATTPAVANVRGGNETILIVEDEPSLRAVVKTVLASLGYQVLEAPTGVSALDVWQKHRNEIQLLFTDMVMPDGMNGKELAQRLLADKPQLKVIYASGYSADIAGQDLPLQEGVNFLSKPFLVHNLAQTIRNRLDEI